MRFKKIIYWNGKKWMPLNLKTDSIHIETKYYYIDIVDDRDVKKVQITSKLRKDIEGRNMSEFIAFIK